MRGRYETSPARSACSASVRIGRASHSWYARAAMIEAASDAELLERIAAGGSSRTLAEVELCRRFAPRIQLYGVKHLRDSERSRDLTQTVLIAVIAAAREQRIDDPQRVDRFVFGTCRNTVARMREQTTRTPLAAEEHIAALANVPPPAVELQSLYGCIAKLEERASRVLMMSFLEERSADEIATKLSIAAGNVRVIRHRALGQLRQCLDSAEASP